MSDFPNRLKKLRSDSKLTQKQLAEKLSVSQNAIYNWENGKREPNLDMMKRIAKVFDIALYILLDDTCPLPDITSDAWKNRARFHNDTEMETPPKRFTLPNQDRTYQDEPELKLRTNDGIYDYERLDELEYNGIILKLGRGVELSPQEINFKAAYEERELKKIGNIFAKFYTLLNEQGRKKADEQIARTLEAIELLTKVPEYQKNPKD